MSDRKVDTALEDTFPASDPPAHGGITGDDQTPRQPKKGNTDDRPTGTPTSDRHATETAYHQEKNQE